MPPTISAARLVTLSGPDLSREAVELMARQISTDLSAASTPIVIDCDNVREVAAQGLTALLELRARHESVRWALVRLSRAVLTAALEIGLAERLAICTDAAAADRMWAAESTPCVA